MRMKSVMFALAATLCSAPLAAHPPVDKAAETKKVREVEEVFLRAQTGQQVAAEFSDDAVMYDPMPPTFNGRKAIEKHMVEVYSALRNPRAELLSLHIEVDHDLAFAFSAQRMMTFDDKGQKTGEMIMRVTDCYRKIDGKWKVVHNHSSLPVDMQTGKMLLKADLDAPQ